MTDNSHPDDARLIAHLEGRLPVEEREAIAALNAAVADLAREVADLDAAVADAAREVAALKAAQSKSD